MKAKKAGNLKKLSALLLAIIITVRLIMPDINVALATDSANYTKSVSQENDMSISGTDSFGTMLADELSNEVENQNNNGCNIFEVKMEENTAVVNFETRQDAVLIVGIYTEDGSKMVASGIMDVMEGETDVFVDIEAELPEYYLIKSFLVDTEDYSPLCTSYESSYYTKEMQDLLAKTTDDFEESRVLNLDEDKTNNFAIYSDEVKLIELNTSVNNIISEDEEKGIYVIENADETVTSLKVGDIFAGTKVNGDELIVKVKSIQKNGTTVTITSDDTSLDEVFDYVKIDAEAGLDKAEVDNSYCEEGVTYAGMIEWQDEVQTYAIEGEGKISTGLSYKLYEKEVGNDVVKGKVSGSVDLKIEASAEVYITLSYQYIEIKLGYEMKIGVEVSGEVNGKIPLGYVAISPIPGLYISFTPSVVFEAEVKFEMNATLKGSIGFAYDSNTGGKNISSIPELETEIQIEGTIFIGLSLEPKISIINDNIASAELGAKLGAEAKATLIPTEEDSDISEHECKKCLDGEIYGKLEIEFKVQALNLEKLTWKNKFEIKVHIADFYFSFDKMEFGLGKCPYISYKVTVTVEDKDGNVLEGVNINDTYTTDEKGQAVFYVPNGVYELKAAKTGYEDGKTQITVKNEGKVVTVVMGVDDIEGGEGEKNDEDEEEIDEDGNYKYVIGNSTYTYSKLSDGTLEIVDYEGTDTDIIIPEEIRGKKVTSIGDCAFWGCISLTSIEIPDGVTSIGSFAFCGCSSLISIKIPLGVTSIGTSAFCGCSSLASIKIPSSVTSIGDFAFYECSSLASIKIPSSVTSIGSLAFYECSSLTIYGIKGSVAEEYAVDYDIPFKEITEAELENDINTLYEEMQVKEDVAVYSNLYTNSGKEYIDKSYIATYDFLEPDKEYLFFVIKSEEGDILTSDNILYIAQGKADTDGNLTFIYNLADDTENKIEKLSGVGKFNTGEVNITSGDVNGDGTLDIKDSALLKRYLAGWEVEIDEEAADVDGDGKVTIKDSALVKRQLAGWE